MFIAGFSTLDTASLRCRRDRIAHGTSLNSLQAPLDVVLLGVVSLTTISSFAGAVRKSGKRFQSLPTHCAAFC
ncbi:hypothetical protein BDV28DRAFT_135971 [Aspergillus coremiiformis]|uniref:Uncharacterized protein n=1 Tax=Aspergillus coremiiformis TaxID=138285 RepID=A0A5N6Z4C1_9EURO|nr:hypothetical protein BDV28DRAFT_135971 [Aspergillus coremiiformis]